MFLIGGEAMPVSKAQQKAVAKYTAANYDRIEVKVPKGEKQIFIDHAENQKESLQAFFYRAAKQTMEQDKAKEAE